MDTPTNGNSSKTNGATAPKPNRAQRRAKGKKSATVTVVAKPDNTNKYYKMGEALGAQQGEHDATYGVSVRDALKACVTPDDRKALRNGFVDVYSGILRASGHGKAKAKEMADNHFSYLGRKYSPQTSRKAKHNAKKKKSGRKAKKSGSVTEVSGKALAVRITNGMNYAALMMQNPPVGRDAVILSYGVMVAVLNGDADADGKAIKGRKAKKSAAVKADHKVAGETATD